MKALITDLTRMYDYHACAAGIDMDTGKRVRPVELGRLSAGCSTAAARWISATSSTSVVAALVGSRPKLKMCASISEASDF